MTCAINVLSFPSVAVMGVTKRREMLRRIHRMDELRRVLFFMPPSSRGQDQNRQKGSGLYYLGIENKKGFCGCGDADGSCQQVIGAAPNGINTSYQVVLRHEHQDAVRALLARVR
jgi:hypothetical protein